MEDMVKELTVCTLCHNKKQQPKRLKCMHSFCKTCLVEHITSFFGQGSYPCPICAAATLPAYSRTDVDGAVFRSLVADTFCETLCYFTDDSRDPNCKSHGHAISEFCLDCCVPLCDTCRHDSSTHNDCRTLKDAQSDILSKLINSKMATLVPGTVNSIDSFADQCSKLAPKIETVFDQTEQNIEQIDSYFNNIKQQTIDFITKQHIATKERYRHLSQRESDYILLKQSSSNKTLHYMGVFKNFLENFTTPQAFPKYSDLAILSIIRNAESLLEEFDNNPLRSLTQDVNNTFNVRCEINTAFEDRLTDTKLVDLELVSSCHSAPFAAYFGRNRASVAANLTQNTRSADNRNNTRGNRVVGRGNARECDRKGNQSLRLGVPRSAQPSDNSRRNRSLSPRDRIRSSDEHIRPSHSSRRLRVTLQLPGNRCRPRSANDVREELPTYQEAIRGPDRGNYYRQNAGRNVPAPSAPPMPTQIQLPVAPSLSTANQQPVAPIIAISPNPNTYIQVPSGGSPSGRSPIFSATRRGFQGRVARPFEGAVLGKPMSNIKFDKIVLGVSIGTENGIISGVCRLSKYYALADKFKKCIHVIQRTGDNVKLKKEISLGNSVPWDIAPMTNKKCVVATSESQVLVVVSCNYRGVPQVCEEVSVAAFYISVEYVQNGECFVCGFPRQEQMCSGVDILASQGDVLRSFQLDANGAPLFLNPSKIGVTESDGLVICDDERNTVYLMTSDQMQFVPYMGTGDQCIRKPCSLATIPEFRRVMVLDEVDDQLAVVSSDGVFVESFKQVFKLPNPKHFVVYKNELFVVHGNGDLTFYSLT